MPETLAADLQTEWWVSDPESFLTLADEIVERFALYRPFVRVRARDGVPGCGPRERAPARRPLAADLGVPP